MIELRYRVLTSFAALAATVLFTSASFAETDHDDHEQQHEESEGNSIKDTVALSDEVFKEFGIVVGVAGPDVVIRTVSLPAEIRAIESSESLAPYPLKAQIDGTVIERHITRGEPVSQARGRVFTVADLSEVWVDISVYQKHLTSVQLGQTVHISAGHGLAEAEGTISYVSPIVDEETRTATARVVLANPKGLWRPGLFVTAVVELERVEVPVAVPRTALEEVEGSTVVFVRGQDGFAPRPVTFGLRGRDLVEVTAGLKPGDSYVTKGGFTLKSELAREELADGDDH